MATPTAAEPEADVSAHGNKDVVDAESTYRQHWRMGLGTAPPVGPLRSRFNGERSSYSFYLKDDLAARLAEIAEDEGMSKSRLVEDFLEWAIEAAEAQLAYAANNPQK